MKTITFLALMGLSITGLAGCGHGTAENKPSKPPDNSAEPGTLGVYDSRAVAVAYTDTVIHKEETRNLKAALETAKQKNDSRQIKQCEEAIWRERERRFMQASSTAPVDNIIEKIKARRPDLFREAGVDVLVSMWDRETFSKYSAAKRVDVTDLLIRTLNPTQRQRDEAEEIQKRDPVSLTEAKKAWREYRAH